MEKGLKKKRSKIYFLSEGPNKELYLAEEAIGLAKALNWSVVNGPFWKETEEKEVKKSKDGGAIVEEEVEGKEEGETKEEEYIDLGEKVEGRGRKNSIFSKRKEEEEKMPMGSEWSTMNETDLKNGDYVVTPCFSGIYHVLLLLIFLKGGEEWMIKEEEKRRI